MYACRVGWDCLEKRGVFFLIDGVRIKFHGGLAVYRTHLASFAFC